MRRTRETRFFGTSPSSNIIAAELHEKDQMTGNVVVQVKLTEVWNFSKKKG